MSAQAREVFTDVPYAAPVGAVEEAVAAAWAEVLQLDRVGRDDSYFDFAGTSLQAVRICNRLRDRLGIDVSPALLFDVDSLTEVAEDVARQAGSSTAA